MQVLLVEDEALVAMSLQKELSKREISCVVAATGKQAIALALETKPDLVFMDINLSGSMSGVEAATRIREAMDCPICFISGYQLDDVPTDTLDFEPVAFLQKPVRVASIMNIIQTVTRTP